MDIQNTAKDCNGKLNLRIYKYFTLKPKSEDVKKSESYQE
jgi:hypothetical protein